MRLGLRRPWRHNKLHENVAQMHRVLVPASHTFYLPSLYPWPCGVPYYKRTEEENTQAWFIIDSKLYAGIIWKWTTAFLHPLSGTSLKDSSEERSSQGAGLRVVYLVVYFALKDKRPDVWLYTDSWCVAMIWMDYQGLRRNTMGKLVRRKSGEKEYR